MYGYINNTDEYLDFLNSSTSSIYNNAFDITLLLSSSASSSSSSLAASVADTSSLTTITTKSSKISSAVSTIQWTTMGRIQIPLYGLILLLAIIGNSLVILTLIQHRRMRTITNVFLLNLAVSDILLGVLCMPFTLIGTLLRDFVFGEIMCKILPFLQASSVAVSAWTLVAISCERYYAICHPLRSRRWQTLKHAYKLIGIIWFSSLLCMSPIVALSKLIPTSQGHHKCRELWPKDHKQYEKVFNIFLDLILLIIPLICLGATYSLITRTLWKGMKNERASKKPATNTINNNNNNNSNKNIGNVRVHMQIKTTNRCPSSCHSRERTVWHQIEYSSDDATSMHSVHKTVTTKKLTIGLRRTNTEKSLQNKKRVIQMLFVVVLEFFICWTPLYVINTIALFQPMLVYQNLGYTSISFFQLLAYSSSCCNPITYCFMNRGFRKACINLFHCCKKWTEKRRSSIGDIGDGGTANGGSCGRDFDDDREGNGGCGGLGLTQSSEIT